MSGSFSEHLNNVAGDGTPYFSLLRQSSMHVSYPMDIPNSLVSVEPSLEN